MRTIKFRGKRIKDGKWIYGNLADYSMNVFNTTIDKKIIFGNIVSFATDNFGFVVDDCAVYPDTVGQFTGLCDKNGKEIYEGDILSTDLAIPRCEVVFRNGCFALRLNDGDEDFYDIISPIDESVDKTKYHNIIGSIHDNPDLLNGK